MLPAYPWLALLVGDAIVRCLRGQHRDLEARAFRVALAGWAVLMALAALVPAVMSGWFGEAIGPGVLVAAAALAYVAVVLVLFRRRAAHGLVALGVVALVTQAVLWTVYLPRAQYLRLSVRVAEVLRREGATEPGQAVMLDYKEPSLAFYQGGTIREHPADELKREDIEAATQGFVVTADVWRRTAPDVRDRLRVVDRLKGLAYADGRVVEVMVLRTARGTLQTTTPRDRAARGVDEPSGQ
jgi:hypothetical protein